MVDNFVMSSDPTATLPINDRLYIREYLTYMKSLIKQQSKGKSGSDPQSVEPVVSDGYILEVRILKQQIQQK